MLEFESASEVRVCHGQELPIAPWHRIAPSRVLRMPRASPGARSILVLAGGAMPPPVQFCSRVSAGLKRAGTQSTRESTVR